MNLSDLLEKLDITAIEAGAGTGGRTPACGNPMESISPVDGALIGRVQCAGAADYDAVGQTAQAAFGEWRKVPAPRRGEIVRRMGQTLRAFKPILGELVSLETGKIRSEGEGEIQELIDIADFAVGQSRMLYGLSMHSERPGHRMYEQWHPLGPVGVITAFNFPAAVWGWNALLCLIAGDTVIWKPSSKTPITAIAVMKLMWRVLQKNGVPEGVLNLVIGDRNTVGERMLHDSRLPLISVTGSVAVGRHAARVVGGRLGRVLLELGGNNAVVVTPDADVHLAVRAVLFGAVGTAGQRCTTTRRLILHESIKKSFVKCLTAAYEQVKIGHPLEEGVTMGPLIDIAAVASMQSALQRIRDQGGNILFGGEVLTGGIYNTGTYVRPCIVEARPDMPIIREEIFAPILYVLTYRGEFAEAVAIQNDVPQGLSSAVFTENIRESETFLSAWGSDCGIANVNVGTSGAEIGGAFGGEKDTGGGRESGSDAWKAYMRRQTCTLNWSGELPLAQGIRFGDPEGK